MYHGRRRSPSPPLGGRSRLTARDEQREMLAQEVPLPGALGPSASLQPQALSSRHCFAAGHGSLLSISGGSLFETNMEGHQQVQLGPRPRPLTCLANSPCGKWWAMGESCFGGRSGQVIILNSEKEVAASLPVGVRRTARHVCWAARGELVAAIVEFESEQVVAADQQLMVWSWPSGERLASSSCGRGAQDIAGSPDGAVLLTVGPCGAKLWTLIRSQDSTAVKGAGVKASFGVLPLRLVGRALPALPGPKTSAPSLRRRPEDALVAVAWGLESCLFLATRQGGLGLTFCDSNVQQKTPIWRDMGRRAFSLAWCQGFAGQAERAAGMLACGLSGRVEILDAADMTTLWKLEADGSGPQLDAVGLACNPLGCLWALYADRSLSYFSEPLASRDACWTLPGAVSDLRSAQGLPGHVLTKVVTHSPSCIQLWSSQLQGDLRLEAQSEPAQELSAVAVSPWLVACGLSNGEVCLFAALHGLTELGPLPMRHAAEVLALSFGHWKPASLRPIILASVSQDRSALVFSIEVQGEAGINSSQASLLLHLQHHSGPVHNVSLLAAPSALPPGSEVFRMVVCTADQLIWRELEYKDGFTTVHKCARQQACRGSKWVGACADTQRGIFFAACSNRRLLQLDPAGRRVQEVRLAGGNSVEIAGPLHLSSDGRFLAVVLKGAAGVLLCDAGGASLQPLARLAAGQAEPPSGVTILPGHRIIACWSDGTMLSWQAPEKQLERRRSHDAEESARRYTSPAMAGGTRPRITGKGGTATTPAIHNAGFHSVRPYSGSPPRGRRSGKGISRGTAGPQGTRDAHPYSARRQQATKSAKSDTEKNQIREAIKAQLPQENKARILFDSQRGSRPGPEGLQALRKLLASSPSPPRWAETSMVEENVSRHGRPSEPLGKWARGSLVGAQVRSASDLHRVGPREDLLDEEPPARCASEGAQLRRGHLKRRLFCPCGRCGMKLPLPPKPLFPPPGPLISDSLLEISAISSSSSAVPTATSDQRSGIGRCERALFSLPTPCRGGRADKNDKSQPKVDMEELVDSVVTLQTRLASIKALPSHEAENLLAPLQKFEALLRSQMKDSHEM